MANTEARRLFELRQKLRPVTPADLTPGVPTLKNVYYRPKTANTQHTARLTAFAAHQQETHRLHLCLHWMCHTTSCHFVTSVSLISSCNQKMDLSTGFIYILAGHPLRGWPARLRGHKGSGLWKVWTVPSPPLPPSLPPSLLPSLSRAMSPKRQSAESAVADEPV